VLLQCHSVDDEIYLTERVEDLIIRGGHNIDPDDLENAVGKIEGLPQGCLSVFSNSDATRPQMLELCGEHDLTR